MKTFQTWKNAAENPIWHAPAGAGMNARLLKEARELESRWAKTRLLSGIVDRTTRQTTAVLLESQRLMNEQATKPERVREIISAYCGHYKESCLDRAEA